MFHPSFTWSYALISLGQIPRSRIAGLFISVCRTLEETCKHGFPKRMYHCASPPAMDGNSGCSTCPPCLNTASLPFFFFGPSLGMQKFPGQGLDMHHSSNTSHSSDNAGSSTCWAIRELLMGLFPVTHTWPISMTSQSILTRLDSLQTQEARPLCLFSGG